MLFGDSDVRRVGDPDGELETVYRSMAVRDAENPPAKGMAQAATTLLLDETALLRAEWLESLPDHDPDPPSARWDGDDLVLEFYVRGAADTGASGSVPRPSRRGTKWRSTGGNPCDRARVRSVRAPLDHRRGRPGEPAVTTLSRRDSGRTRGDAGVKKDPPLPGV